MIRLPLLHFIFLLLLAPVAGAQVGDSSLHHLLELPRDYVNVIDKKIEQYSHRLTGKTEKTLVKLSRWENKVKTILQRVNPEAANRLFGSNQPTFNSVLQKLQQGVSIVGQYQASYNKYLDEASTSLKYLTQQKEALDSGLLKKVKATTLKMQELAIGEERAEELQVFIKERKKQLIGVALQHIGHSRHLSKINKESFYYAETVKNYREILSDPTKAEERVKGILTRVPAFQQFMQKNSQLASLFGQRGDDVASEFNMAGLQTRAAVQSLLQDRVGAGWPNAQEAFRQQVQQAQAALANLKDKLQAGAAGGGNSEEMPDFKPNMQKTKTFLQRLEYGFNLQFGKTTDLLPATADIAVSLGYKINDRSVIGAGAGYKLGIGSARHIRFTHEGIGLRSFIDWKMKKQLYISGGYELNHHAQFKNIAHLKNYDAWQRSALIGLTKKISIKTNWFKSTRLQLLYDFLSRRHLPVSQPVVFRVGYGL